MAAIKLKKHGNSYGFTVPSTDLKAANLSMDDEFEMIISHNSVTFVKRRPDNRSWEFTDTKLSSEDRCWLEADLGVKDE